MRLSRLSLIAAFVGLAPFAGANVLVLQSGGGAQLNTLVASAADGDTILVKGGGAFTSVDIVGKGVRIVADGVAPTIQRIHVANTTAAQLASVSGFRITSPIGPSSAIHIENCAGSVRFVGVNYDTATQASNPTLPGAQVEGSSDVAFTRCTLLGGNATWIQTGVTTVAVTPAEVGVLCRTQSRVALFECVVRGGLGTHGGWGQAPSHVVYQRPPTTPGAAGVEVDDTSTCFSASSSLQGGPGGNGAPNVNIAGTFACTGPTNGSSGGDALVVSPTAHAELVASTATGGAGGNGMPGGQCCLSCPSIQPSAPGAPGAGSPNTLGGSGVTLTMPAHARVTDTIPITMAGTPGAQAILAVSLGSQFAVALPFQGVFTCGPAFRRLSLGVIPGSGVLATSLTIPELAGLSGSLMLHVQIVTQDLAFQTRVGTGQVLCMFDPSY